MYFKYGPHQHPDNEVNLTRMEIIPVMSRRNKRLYRILRLHLQGELKYAGQATLNTKIGELVDAYNKDRKGDAGLYHDDGTPTRHTIPTNRSDCLTGVLVRHRSWPIGAPAEYATTRTFSIVLEAWYDEAEPNLEYWQETIEHVGTTGPLWECQVRQVGPSVPRPQTQRTPMRIRQYGQALGFVTFVPPPGSYWGASEHEDRRRVSYTTPNPQGNAFYAHYATEWSYIHSFPQATGSTPPIV